MAERDRVGDLELHQDLEYERRSLTLRRLFAVVWALVLVAALLGMFGTGPLSDARAVDGSLHADYERFTRFGTATELSIAPGAGEGMTNIAISRSYLKEFVIESMLPQPDGETVLSDRIVYTFDLRPPTVVKFFMTPRQIGVQKATIWGSAGDSLSYTQFVYP